MMHWGMVLRDLLGYRVWGQGTPCGSFGSHLPRNHCTLLGCGVCDLPEDAGGVSHCMRGLEGKPDPGNVKYLKCVQ